VIAAGQSIGNYRILNKIGTGGMGAVYLAEHPLIGKRVALKVIHRELAGNRDVVSRFFQEARAVNKIGNEHIVEIHDFGVTPEGDHFFIMEYLEGRTLASILSRESALDVLRALHIGAQIAAALTAAHAAGIIHRDLKPDNIMLLTRLGDKEFVKVLDFGLAKVFSAATAVKTAAGVLLGTPHYMSPEACESKGDVDHRTDIYALGVLLFQMMTGVLPFSGETMGEVLVKQVTALPPAPRGINPAIPPSVEQILLRCLAKPVDARFATMAQLREALLDPEAYLRGAPPIAPARSVGPGEARVDARTVIAHTDQLTLGAAHASQQKTRLAIAGPLPLPAPALSLMGPPAAPTVIADAREPGRRASSGMPALPAPQEPAMNTMRIATPVGYSSRAPRKVWPVVLVLALLLGFGGGVLSVWFGGDGAADGSGDGEPEQVAGAPGASGSAGDTDPGGSNAERGAGSAAEEPAETSGSAAPVATGSAPAGPDSTGESAATGSQEMGAVPGTTGATGAAPGTTGAVPGTTSGASGASVEGAGSSATGADVATSPPPVKTTARLAIDSAPRGASVIGPGGRALGKTPLKVDWPVSDLPVTFELRLPGYKRKVRQTVVSGNTALRIELERVAAVRRNRSTGPNRAGNRDKGGDNSLMRPE
jgi:tRNA A-37 threonylcarbamoyl transferase component Bud32